MLFVYVSTYHQSVLQSSTPPRGEVAVANGNQNGPSPASGTRNVIASTASATSGVSRR